MRTKALSLGVLLGFAVIGFTVPARAQSEKVTAPSGWVPKSVAYVKASNTAKSAQFGAWVAVSGDGNTMAVGAVNESGGAKGINGNQTAKPEIKDSGAAYVNADPNDDNLSGTGSVYIFTRSGNTWTAGAYVKAPNARTSAEFGKSVALSTDGKTLAVGSFYETSAAKGINGNQADTSAPEAGAAYVFY